MKIKKRHENHQTSNKVETSKAWARPDVLLASLAINLLALALPTVILQVYDRIIPNQAYSTFTLLICGMLVVVFLDSVLKIFRSKILSWEAARFDHKKSLKAMNKILDMNTTDFQKYPPGYYLDKMHALEQVQEFYSGQSLLLAMDFPFVLLFLALIYAIAGTLVFIPLTLLLLFIIVSFITGRKLRKALDTKSSMEDRRQNFVIETLQGIHTIKSMAMEPFMIRRYERLQEQSADSVYELAKINSMVSGIGATFSQLATISFVSIGSLFVINGQLSIGAIAAGTMLSSRAMQPGMKAMGLWTQFQGISLAYAKVQQLFNFANETSGTNKPKHGVKGELCLHNVSFQYDNHNRKLLDEVNLTINPGESIGISGSNGAGKSTTISLMSGYREPTEGYISLDGIPLDEWDIEYLREQVGIVPQRGILFEGTILENMTLYREGDTVEQALELAKLLGLEEIIARLPAGLDTQVGGAAVDTLSEGVRQKIIMVRSLVGHPKLILLDDANANFDIKNDNKLLTLLKKFKGDRTMVIVSHRPSFLRMCDRQYILKDGKFIEQTIEFPSTKKVSVNG